MYIENEYPKEGLKLDIAMPSNLGSYMQARYRQLVSREFARVYNMWETYGDEEKYRDEDGCISYFIIPKDDKIAQTGNTKDDKIIIYAQMWDGNDWGKKVPFGLAGWINY